MLRSLWLLAVPLIAAAAPPADRAEPYRILAMANDTLDPLLAASAYAAEAKLIFNHPGRPAETFHGHDAIRVSYVSTFSQVDPGSPIRLRFRFEPPGLSADRQQGIYRIDASAGGRPITLYGSFAVKLVKHRGAWRFAEDRGSPATAADFDKLPPGELGAE